MAITKLKYSTLDFNTIKNELISRLSQDARFVDYDFTGANITTILEIISAVGDLFTFYLNMLADESFIDTVELYENMNRLSELTGYNPSGYKASETQLTLSESTSGMSSGYRVEIPEWTIFQTGLETEDGEDILYLNPIRAVSLVSSTDVTAGTVDVIVSLVQGSKNTKTYVADGSNNLALSLPELTVIEENISVSVNSVLWDRVSNIFENTSGTSKVYTTRYNKDKKIEIRFGDSLYGKAPALNDTIDIVYITTLGSDGNIAADSINTINGTINVTDLSSIITNQASVSTMTHALTEGGDDPETIEEIRTRAPTLARAQRRAVTPEDYATIVTSQFSNLILKAKAFAFEDIFTDADTTKLGTILKASSDSSAYQDVVDILLAAGTSQSKIDNIMYSPGQTNNTIYYNNVYLIAVPRFGDTITDNLRAKIEEYIEPYNMVSINVVLLSPQYINVDIGVTYRLTSNSSRTISEVESDMRAILSSFFDKTNNDLGQKVIHSDLVDLLNDVSDVDSIILQMSKTEDAPAAVTNTNIYLAGNEFPKLNTNTINITLDTN